MSEALIYKLTMPKWGLTMEEGTIVEWLCAEGAEVKPGAELLEVETDKSTQSVETRAQGILRRIVVQAGESAPVGALLAVIAEPAVSAAQIDEFIASFARPLEQSTEEPPATDTGDTELSKPLSPMRAAIARTVTSGWAIPQFPVSRAIEMTPAEQLYRKLKTARNPLSLNDLIIKAASMALQKFPMVNASLSDNNYILHPQINIAIAVGLEDGLVLPVIKGCQCLSLQQIASKSRELSERARSGRSAEEDLADGNFSISNLGMLGVDNFAALVPPGQAAILAVGAVNDEALVKDGQILAGRIMRVTLSADHRIVDGVCAASFLAELKQLLETPASLES